MIAFDQDRRPQYHKKALSSLLKSLEMDNTSWETYYQTALQHAEMRDIYGAITMITKSLQLFSSHLPSWHLLALLCTCPIKDNLGQALKTCEMAIEEAGLYYLKENNWVEYNDDIAQQMLLQMTHTLLIEKVQQSSTTESAASTAQANLFQLFGKIVVPELIPDVTSNDHLFHEAAISNGSSNNTRYGMVLSGSLGNMEQQMTPPASTSTLSGFSTSNERLTVPNANATRGRSSSNASSSIATNERARSISSFTGRKFHLAEMFHHSSSDASSVKSVPLNNNNTKAPNRHHYKLNLLGRKKSTTKKQDIAGVGVTTNGKSTLSQTKTKTNSNRCVIFVRWYNNNNNSGGRRIPDFTFKHHIHDEWNCCKYNSRNLITTRNNKQQCNFNSSYHTCKITTSTRLSLTL